MLDVTKISRYDVIERISENAFSVVYRGRDSIHHRPVAIKVCIASDVALRNRFLRLAEAAAPLRHPNIVEVLEFGSGDGRPYLIEEFLPGGDLRDWIDRGDPVAGEHELEILDEIARALEYAHRKGVLHQDLKPATVHLEEGHRVKLVDFGLARLNTAAAKLREPGENIKADGYLPPEQALGLPADARTDLYCFGALAYELITKLPPFPRGRAERIPTLSAKVRPEPLTSFWPECPAPFVALVDRCLALSPGDRFASFEELRDELTPLVEGMKGKRRAYQARRVPARPEAALPAPSSLDDTMAIPPDLLVHRTAPPPVEVASEPMVERPTDNPLDDTRETTLPLPPEVVAAAAAMPVAPVSPALRPLPPRPAPRRPGARGVWLGTGALVLAAVALIVVLTMSSGPARPPAAAPQASAAPPPVPATGTAAPAVTGMLVVDATPWGQVGRVATEEGGELTLPMNRYTPLVLAVPPGAYTVEITRAGFDGSRTCTATVVAGGSARCSADLGRVEATDYFKEAGWWR